MASHKASHALPKVAITISAAFGLMLSSHVMAAKPAGKGKNSTATESAVTNSGPLALATEDYNFRNLSGDNSCLGEDDHLIWEALGSLQPGESFSFTPKYPACNYHPAAITVQLSWEGSELELSSTVPYRDYSSSDVEQTGKAVVAPNVGNTSQLCMFPNYKEEGINYTITVTNIGDTAADNIVVDGHSENDWVEYYYNRCVNADADNDGWNDALEHTMGSLVRYIGYIDGDYQMDTLWGPNYLRAQANTLGVNDEVDSYPADVNDDGTVDQLDLARIGLHLGEGNGIPLEAISPNPSDPAYLYANVFEWRRFDLDGDGYVSQTDIDIAAALVGYLVPTSEDIIAPTARVVYPEDGGTIAKGGYTQIKGHVWDNANIVQVDYIVNGRTECSATRPSPNWGTTSPFYYCGWNVPKKQGVHEIEILVRDGADNVSTSGIIQVTAQ
ncbi:Ig-like domain-containing protein [Marinobacterium mangrovicola]|uniref:Putative repeat protein (TIGR01451 family) n=1 Tax=Marinobacterium mangrovicola TaxID=1476959 RepID=A0A4R1GP79_9GAMM|nr:Ig-like domain-containing protein [Marinobacterium mangrovicola]TCK08775.1 putative repeat protein (TIGR01451 family) [Marinobacterium mangrovicola]